MRVLENPEILRSILESIHSGVYFVGRDQRILVLERRRGTHHRLPRQDVVGHYCRDLFPLNQCEELTGVLPYRRRLAAVLRDGKAHLLGHSHPSPRRTSGLPAGVGHSDSRRRWDIVGAAESFEEDRARVDSDRRRRKLEEYGCVDQARVCSASDISRTVLQGMLLTSCRTSDCPSAWPVCESSRLPELRAQYGPAALREILHAVAETVTNSLRPTDSLGRLDDETFLAILPECNAIEAEHADAPAKHRAAT